MTSFFQHLKLRRPMCVIDCETTGLSTQHDRIVEIAVARFAPGKNPRYFVQQINPGIDILASATAIHGIANEDVTDCPYFHSVARTLRKFLSHSDLVGFNLVRFDLPLLLNEFARAKEHFTLKGRKVIDVQRLYHRLHRRDLNAAVQEYLGHECEELHRASADVSATASVLDSMLQHHPELPDTVDQLHQLQFEVDLAGRLRREDHHLILTFGKYQNQHLQYVASRDPSYLEWLLRQDFLPDFKAVIAHVLKSN